MFKERAAENAALLLLSITNHDHGLTWERLGHEPDSAGFLYGPFEPGNATGADIAFVYPDMRTALLGEFSEGRMVAAKVSKLHTMRSE